VLAPAVSALSPITAGKAHGACWNGRSTFIPKMLTTKVGTMRTIEMMVSRFITILRLLEITDAKASIMPVRMSE